jgi:transposase
VRIALTSGLMCKQVADYLGVGMSTLNKWVTAHRDIDVMSKGDLSLTQENDQLRRNVNQCYGHPAANVLRSPTCNQS